jgi:hypothetical protein
MTAKSVGFTQTAGAQQDTDVNSAGKTIGFDDLYITFTGRNTAAAGVALDIKGGFLYGTFATANAGKTWHGKVTGWTRAFTGAIGTITANAIAGHKTAVTITYTT